MYKEPSKNLQCSKTFYRAVVGFFLINAKLDASCSGRKDQLFLKNSFNIFKRTNIEDEISDEHY